jgi:hypothetical protein
MLAKGIPAAVVMRVGGWKRSSTMDIYLRLAGVDVKGLRIFWTLYLLKLLVKMYCLYSNLLKLHSKLLGYYISQIVICNKCVIIYTMKRENKGIKPQDILLLSKLISLNGMHERQIDLATDLDLSQAEVANSLERLKRASLIDETKKNVNRLAAIEFFKHAIKFLFPIEYDAPSRGVLIGPSAEFIRKEVRSRDDMSYILEDLNGESSGVSIRPIYPSVLKAIKGNEMMYQLLCLVDVLRGLGGVRHRQFAETEISKIILRKGNA